MPDDALNTAYDADNAVADAAFAAYAANHSADNAKARDADAALIVALAARAAAWATFLADHKE